MGINILRADIQRRETSFCDCHKDERDTELDERRREYK